jgi:hypothetical protein
MTLELTPTIVGQDGKAYGVLTVDVVVEPKEDESVLSVKSKITPLAVGDTLRLNLAVKVAKEIPHQLSTFVNARFSLFGEEEMMVPEMSQAHVGLQKTAEMGGVDRSKSGSTVYFDRERQYGVQVIKVTEKFLTYLKTSMHTIQIWGNNVNVTNEVTPTSQWRAALCSSSLSAAFALFLRRLLLLSFVVCCVCSSPSPAAFLSFTCSICSCSSLLLLSFVPAAAFALLVRRQLLLFSFVDCFCSSPSSATFSAVQLLCARAFAHACVLLQCVCARNVLETCTFSTFGHWV